MAPASSTWPRWPDNVKGKQLVHVSVARDVNALFKTLFGTASPFVVSSIILCYSLFLQLLNTRAMLAVSGRTRRAQRIHGSANLLPR